MGDMEAERFYNRFPRFEIQYGVLVDIFRKELPGLFKLMDLLQGVLYLFLRISAGKAADDGFIRQIPVPFDQSDQFINQSVHNMDAAAVHIQNDVITIQRVLMNQTISPSAAGRAGRTM